MYYAANGYEVQGVYIHFPFYFLVCKPPPTFYLPNMKIFALALITFSAVNAAAESSLHLRVHTKGGACTITKESQCDGQNWTGSTCCADSGYECRWSDDGQNVKRCQKKWGTRQHHKAAEVESGSKDTEDDWGSSDSDDYGVDSEGSEINSGSDDSEDWYGSKGSEDEEEGNWSESSEPTDDYSESSEVYSGSDDYNEGSEFFGSEGSEFEGWFGSASEDESYYTYDEGESDVSAKQHHHHHHHHKRLAKGGCTITNESQCDGQNWTGSTCCADSSYECRWSDDGQNVKRCQKKRGLKL